MEKTKRSANFSSEEIHKLMDLVKKYKDIVECKKSDSVFLKEKLKTWQKIAVEFNSSSRSSFRDSKTLKTKYENLKKNSKQKFAQQRQQVYATGGGIAEPSNIDDIDNAVHELLNEQVTGLDSVVDCDTVFIDLGGAQLLDLPDEPPQKENESTANGKNETLRAQDSKRKLGSDNWSTLAEGKMILTKDKGEQQLELHQMQIKQAAEEHDLKKKELNCAIEKHELEMKHMEEEFHLKKIKLNLEIAILKKKFN